MASLLQLFALAAVSAVLMISTARGDQLPPETAPPVDAPDPFDSSTIGAASDSTVRKMSLGEAIAIALDTNIDLALSRAQHEVAQARSFAARSAMAPSLELGANLTSTEGLVQGAFGDFRDVDAQGVGAGTSLSLRVNLGARIHESIAARREVDAAYLDTLSAEQKLVLNVVELYENLVLAQAGTDIAGELLASSESFLRIATVRFEGGVALGTDAARARANVAAARQQQVQAENLLRTSGVRLAVVLRLDPSQAIEPADTTLEAWQLPEGMETAEFVRRAAHRPDVEAAQERIEVAERTLKSRWWDLVAPDLYAEWRLYGIGGEGDKSQADLGQSLSSAAGSAGRSASAWQNVATALNTPGASVFPSLSNAAGSAGRSYYAYRNLLESPHQDLDGLSRQERFSVGLSWNLSFGKVARIKEQRINVKSARLRAEKAEEAAVGEAHLAQQDIEAALRLLTFAADELHAAEESHRLSLARFQGGTALAFEVLDAQDTFTEARLKLVRYTAAMNIAQARLLTAAGVAYEFLPPQFHSGDETPQY